MKIKVLSVLALTSILFTACGGETKDKHAEETTTETAVVAETYKADITTSIVNWRGEVFGVYGHEGYVNLQSGWITLEGETIIAGEIYVDMSNIVPTDSASFTQEEGHRITDLQGHLTTGDFFNTSEFPTSTFVITSVEGNTIKGNLTVRDKTNEETIEVESLEVVDGKLTAKGKLVFNRQNYNVAWVHYMKDMVLSDDITLNLTLVANK